MKTIKSFEQKSFGLSLIETSKGYSLITRDGRAERQTKPTPNLGAVLSIFDQLLSNFITNRPEEQ